MNVSLLRVTSSDYLLINETSAVLVIPKAEAKQLEQAKLIDQFADPTWYWPNLGIIHFIAGRYNEAIIHFSRSASMSALVHGYLAASFALTDQRDQAARHITEALREAPDFSGIQFLAKEPLKQAADRDRLLDGRRKAGLPE